MPISTIVNAGAVIVGSMLGTLLGTRLPERIRRMVLNCPKTGPLIMLVSAEMIKKQVTNII